MNFQIVCEHYYYFNILQKSGSSLKTENLFNFLSLAIPTLLLQPTIDQVLYETPAWHYYLHYLCSSTFLVSHSSSTFLIFSKAIVFFAIFQPFCFNLKLYNYLNKLFCKPQVLENNYHIFFYVSVKKQAISRFFGQVKLNSYEMASLMHNKLCGVSILKLYSVSFKNSVMSIYFSACPQAYCHHMCL